MEPFFHILKFKENGHNLHVRSCTKKNLKKKRNLINQEKTNFCPFSKSEKNEGSSAKNLKLAKNLQIFAMYDVITEVPVVKIFS